MKRLCLVAVLALSGCAGGMSAMRGDRIDWRCDGGAAFSVRVNEATHKAEVFAGGRVYRLDQIGAGYSNEQVRYIDQGGSASLMGANGGPYDNCRRNQG